MSSRRQRSIQLDGRYRQVSLYLLNYFTMSELKLIHVRKSHPWWYHQTSNISRTPVGNEIVDHSYVVGASSVGAAPTTSSFPTWHLASIDWAKTTARRDEIHLSDGILCVLYWRLDDKLLVLSPTGDNDTGDGCYQRGVCRGAIDTCYH